MNEDRTAKGPHTRKILVGPGFLTDGASFTQRCPATDPELCSRMREHDFRYTHPQKRFSDWWFLAAAIIVLAWSAATAWVIFSAIRR